MIKRLRNRFIRIAMLSVTAVMMLLTIILSSSVLYELIGPACAKAALFRSGAIDKEALPQPQARPHRLPERRKRVENGLTKRLWR